MANITNSEVIKFSNDFIRVGSDKKAQDYFFSKMFVNRWNALDLSNKITNNSADFIVDGAYGTDGTDGDGRPVINGADAYNLYTRCTEIISDYEANSNAKLNTILNCAVNIGD